MCVCRTIYVSGLDYTLNKFLIFGKLSLILFHGPLPRASCTQKAPSVHRAHQLTDQDPSPGRPLGLEPCCLPSPTPRTLSRIYMAQNPLCLHPKLDTRNTEVNQTSALPSRSSKFHEEDTNAQMLPKGRLTAGTASR